MAKLVHTMWNRPIHWRCERKLPSSRASAPPRRLSWIPLKEVQVVRAALDHLELTVHEEPHHVIRCFGAAHQPLTRFFESGNDRDRQDYRQYLRLPGNNLRHSRGHNNPGIRTQAGFTHRSLPKATSFSFSDKTASTKFFYHCTQQFIKFNWITVISKWYLFYI